MVFQNPDNQFVSTVVKEDVEFSLKNHDIKYNDKTIDDVLSLVGLKGFEKKYTLFQEVKSKGLPLQGYFA